MSSLKHSPLKEIRFNEHIPDFYDGHTDSFYSTNLVSCTAASFVNALLNNVFIEKCDIMLPSEYQRLSAHITSPNALSRRCSQ